MEGNGNRSRGEILQADAQRAGAAGSRSGRLGAPDGSDRADPQHVRRRCGMNWLQRLFGRQKMEEQLDQELRFHLENHVAQLMRSGVPGPEARRRARLAIGWPEEGKEE